MQFEFEYEGEMESPELLDRVLQFVPESERANVWVEGYLTETHLTCVIPELA
jgi:hypothetical protein